MEQAESPQLIVQAFLDATDRLGNLARHAAVGKALVELLELTQTLMFSVDEPSGEEEETIRVMALFRDGRRLPVLRKSLLEAIRELSGTSPVKYCSRCKKPKPLDKYTTCRTEPDGRHHACKECERKRQAEYYRKRVAAKANAAAAPEQPARSESGRN